MSNYTHLAQKTTELQEIFSAILDLNETSGELRVKLAAAELMLFKIAKLMRQQSALLSGEDHLQ